MKNLAILLFVVGLAFLLGRLLRRRQASPPPLLPLPTMAYLEPAASSAAWAFRNESAPTVLAPVEPQLENGVVGPTLEHFRILHRLGQGGMGEVYRALDESLLREVAIKVIRPTSEGGGTEATHRLLMEARAQARVNHPNVVHIYYVSRDDRNPFFAMELIEGPTLGQRLRQEKLPFDEVVGIGLQIASALQHAARLEILHGDLKPNNILCAANGVVKLSDFGLSRHLADAAQASGGIAGTPDYLSPEGTRGAPQDVRSDMYSLGVTLFEMTFGRHPYTNSSSSLKDRLLSHQTAKIEFPRPWPNDIPRSWEKFLERLLAKDPRDRFLSYGDLLEEMKKHQPVVRVPAGAILRSLCFALDLLIAALVDGLVTFLLIVPFRDEIPRWILFPSAPLVSASFAALQATLRNSLGKKLLQLRIVDLHGLPPSRWMLFLRGLWTLSPLLVSDLDNVFDWMGHPWLSILLVASVSAVLLTDGLVMLFQQQRRSFHDLLFGTQVVLDAHR